MPLPQTLKPMPKPKLPVIIVLVGVCLVILGGSKLYQSFLTTQTSRDKASKPANPTSDYKQNFFATSLTLPRRLVFSPGGVLLVSEIGNGKITALPDRNNDGMADEQITVTNGLQNTDGFAFYKDKLYITEETSVSRYLWDEKTLTATFEKRLFNLPISNGHATRSIVFDQSGKMYVSVGSSCNVCFDSNPFFAAVLISDSTGKEPTVFSSGLRNSVAIAVNPQTQTLWSADNGRDNLGDNLPHEDINILSQGKNYGWPLCYDNKVHDIDFDKKNPTTDPCLKTEPPIWQMEAHSAPVGMAFIPETFNKAWAGDLLISQHGSSHRSTPSGHKIVHLYVKGDRVTKEEDFISTFLDRAVNEARPVGLAFDNSGNLYISDDNKGTIIRVAKK